eukprot:GFKZ01003171.1.p1 GENE.GFKZ01003171.1~~GFKZ01003171.1.p1  ORF type:complete len:741 (+),score=107.27 GFKZ01003171.1:129-2351(+)
MKRRRDGKAVQAQQVEPNGSLPILEKSDEILSAIAANDVLILIAQTGSGKTTQIPQLIVKNQQSASVVITQPRRVAAITVASRVAKERGVDLGREVGYAVRFQDRSNRALTSIRYVTDGVLLREALNGGVTGLKKRYTHVVVDEVHERSVNTDIVLGIIKQTLTTAIATKNQLSKTGFAAKNQHFANMLSQSKLPFKVIIMSATTDSEKIEKFFKDKTSLRVSVLKIPGATYRVRVMNATAPVLDYIAGILTVVNKIHSNLREPGDILVFLPGQEEIMSAMSIVKDRIKHQNSMRGLRPFPLYAALAPEEQLRAIQPLPPEDADTARKVIFATNIAETSVTIPGVNFVVDTGLVKVRSLIHDKGVFADVLRTQPLTLAQAEQRRGRAGRTNEGVVYRLYTEAEFGQLEKFPTPEILRADAAATMLQIIVLSDTTANARRKGGKSSIETGSSSKSGTDGKELKEFQKFPLLDDIPPKMKMAALETLCILGAVNYDIDLQPIGRLMARIPVPPMLARSLMESVRVGCVDAMVSLAAVLSAEGNIFVSPAAKREQATNAQRRFISHFGDHLTLVNALNAFNQISSLDKQRRFCEDYFLNFRVLQSAESIRVQLSRIMQYGDIVSWGLSRPLPRDLMAQFEEESVDILLRRCLVAGFFRHAARKRTEDDRYMPIGYGSGSSLLENGVAIHPGSSLRSQVVNRTPLYVIYNELVVTKKAFLRTVVSIEREWLYQHCGHHFKRDKV